MNNQKNEIMGRQKDSGLSPEEFDKAYDRFNELDQEHLDKTLDSGQHLTGELEISKQPMPVVGLER